MKIALIGASSFVGKNIIEFVNTEFKQCKLYASFNKNINFDKNLNITNKNFQLIKVNLNFENDENDLSFIENANLIIFLAGISKPKKISKDTYDIINVKGLKKILKKIKKNQKFIVISSTEAVGPNFKNKPFDEGQECKPITNYGKSKLQLEKLCVEYIKKDYDINIVRPTTIFGAHDKEFLKFFKLNKFKFFPIRSEKKCIEYLHVADLVRLIFFLYNNKIEKGIYNITPKNKLSLNYILKIIEKKTKQKWLNIYLPKKLAGVFFKKTIDRLTEYYFNSSSKKIEKIGFNLSTKTFDECITEVYNYYKNYEKI